MLTKILKAMAIKPSSQSKRTSGSFYGEPIDTETALETTHRAIDYYDALKRCSSKMPIKPEKDLVHLLRCNRIAMHYYTYVNLNLHGISYKRSCLTDEEIIYTWLMAHKLPSQKPLITLGNLQILLNNRE